MMMFCSACKTLMRAAAFAAVLALVCTGPAGPAAAAQNVVDIGEMETYTVREGDTIIDIAYKHGYGFVEVQAANQGVHTWEPQPGEKIILPGHHLVPNAPHEGIVINLGEMRLYYYPTPGGTPVTFPIGIGREGMHTPLGSTTVVRKKAAPTWTPTPRMREDNPDLPDFVPPGPENPLGTHALYLGWPTFAVHGTNRPLGIGRRVSSGCIRMYPEDIPRLFEMVPVGTKVTVVDQPVKIGWIDGELYMEAHPSRKLADEVEIYAAVLTYDVPDGLVSMVLSAAGDMKDKVDWARVRKVVKERRSFPIPITHIKGEHPEVPVIEKTAITPPDVPAKKPDTDADPAEEARVKSDGEKQAAAVHSATGATGATDVAADTDTQDSRLN